MIKTMNNYVSRYVSPLGCITLASDGKFLVGLWLEGQEDGRESLKSSPMEKELPVFVQTKKWLDLYFAGEEPKFVPPLKLCDSPFRKRVQEIMLEIPYGKTMTYGEIAKIIAKEKGVERMSAQAIGGAVGHNTISIIVPCHRVVGSNGSLTGYGGGLDKKIQLLQIEKADLSRLFDPRKANR